MPSKNSVSIAMSQGRTSPPGADRVRHAPGHAPGSGMLLGGRPYAVGLRGFDKFRAMLLELPKGTARKAFRDAFRVVGRRIIAPAIKRHMPKDTGALLRATLTFTSGKTRRNPVAFWIGFPTRKKLAAATIAIGKRNMRRVYKSQKANLQQYKAGLERLDAAYRKANEILHGKYYYPAAVEYGHPRAAARPFLRKAYDSVEERAASDAMERIWANLVTAFKAK